MKGDLLIQIDTRPYMAQLNAAQAEVEHKQAALAYAEVTNKRFKALAQKQAGVVSEAELAQNQALESQAKAALGLAEANRDLAKLNLDSTTVRAPIDGKIGRVLVSEGNLVVADKTAVATIIQAKK